MGTVIRQSIQSSIISYIGVGVGYLNLIILYPRFLEPEQIGLLRTIVDAAILFAPFAQMGLGPAIVRFLPHYANKDDQGYGFITFVLFASLIGYGIFLLCFFLFEGRISVYFEENAAAILDHTSLVLWLTFFLVAMAVLEFYGRALLKITLPNFLREVAVRILQGVLVTLYFLGAIPFQHFLVFSVLIYLLSLVALVFYLIYLGRLRIRMDFSFLTTGKLKQFFSFSFLTLVGNSATMIIAKVDSLMVSAMLGLGENAIYTTAFYIATVIEIPKRSLSQLSLPLLSAAFSQHNIAEVYKVYHKTAINQMIMGLLLLIGVWANVHNLFQLMPRGEIYQAGSYVVLIVGLGRWFDMAFGPSGEVILLSKYYWINVVLIAFLAVLVIGSNYILIPRYGIDGAAIGSALSMIIHNTVKYFLIAALLKVQPFNWKTLKVLGIGAVTVGLNLVLPALDHPIIDTVYRSALITLFFGGLILLSRVSDEAWSVVDSMLKWMRRR